MLFKLFSILRIDHKEDFISGIRLCDIRFFHSYKFNAIAPANFVFFPFSTAFFCFVPINSIVFDCQMNRGNIYIQFHTIIENVPIAIDSVRKGFLNIIEKSLFSK